MQAPRTSWLFALIGIVALCAFVGDIAADSIADVCGDHCISQSSQSDQQHEKAPCSHCSCAVHNGSVIASTSAVYIAGAFQAFVFFATGQQSAPTGLPAAIDHPPQLA